jgi:phosphoglucosamine mutase
MLGFVDGDADRVMILDENGKVADGSQITAMAARWAESDRLKGRHLGGDCDVEHQLERAYLAGKGSTFTHRRW